MFAVTLLSIYIHITHDLPYVNSVKIDSPPKFSSDILLYLSIFGDLYE